MVASPPTCYDQDFALWLEENIALIKAKNYSAVDWDNLIEEVEGLTRRDKRELENRLITLFEHALKRRYVPLPDCYRGWEVTLIRTQQKLEQILKDSPSLRNYILEITEKCYQKALKTMRKEYDATFPNVLPFPSELDQLLSEEFWQ
jgi:iron-sulfur cluster repair protein YtfE (RIC family)